MPLRDHFRPPVKDLLAWDSLCSGWATNLADDLNERRLPPGFVALEHTRGEGWLTFDVKTDEAPPPTVTMPGVFPDDYEVRVFDRDGGNHLVAAIELVTPGNKDRADQRRAFAVKCAAYLQQGVSVAIVDVVTDRRANLHNEIISLIGATDENLMRAEAYIYAVSYRPVLRGEKAEIDLWPASLAVGEALPTMPLRLIRDLFVPVELEYTYTETCRKRRLV